MSAWRVVNVEGWSEDDSDPRGRRAKRWLLDDGQRWLRKSPRESRPSEVAVEPIVLSLARALRLPAAEAMPCEWEGQRGIIVRGFIERPDDELHPGDAVIRGFDPTYEETKEAHTLARAVDSLRALEGGATGSMVVPFVRMLCFDAWVGNGDRHPGNWGVIVGKAGHRLAPMYDPASCLGTELLDSHPLIQNPRDSKALARYVARCGSGFGNGRAMILQAELVDQLRGLPEWRASARPLIGEIEALLHSGDVDRAFQSAPSDWLSEPRRELALGLLKARAQWLSEGER